MRRAPIEAAAWLDSLLGNPGDPANPFSYARCAELDDVDAFPTEICARLDELGVARHYVPARHGGGLTDYETAMQVMRMVARRDITVAVAHGKTYLGGVSVWVGGDAEQAAGLAELIGSGVPVSWGLTERDHGSDLLHGDLVGTATPDGYRLTGEKWLINNATRGGAICVLARTSPAGGPRGFSLFLVDKTRLAAGTYRHLPKVLTHGIRGADISGIEFADAPIGTSALVGAPGTGAETVLKGLQLTRTLCAALSLGGADHALATATRFASERRLYGRRLVDLPAARHTLATAYTDHLMAEALAVVGTRAIHGLTDEMSVLSAAVKYLVPTRVEGLMVMLRKLMGARSLLRDEYEPGGLAKVERDHRIVSLFDGNTLVNLHALVNLFPTLVRAHQRGTSPAAGLAAVTTLTEPLPDWLPERQSLVSRRGSSLLLGLPAVAAEITALAADEPELAPLAALTGRFLTAVGDLHQRLAAVRSTPMDVPKSTFVLAGHLACCLAGAATLHLWLRNRAAFAADSADGVPETAALWRNGIWPQAVLGRVLGAMHDRTCRQTACYPAMFDALASQVSADCLPSLFDCRLAEGRRQPSWSMPC
jgi:alkylation response protein AidB-like acyl-CoA dehydrogenase